MHWNIKGFQAYKLSTILTTCAAADIIALTETKEIENNMMEHIPGYVQFTQYAFVAPEKAKSYAMASGGIKVLCKPEVGDRMSICAKDEDRHYMWLKIEKTGVKPTFLGIAYFPPKDSDLYTHKRTTPESILGPMMEDMDRLCGSYIKPPVIILMDLNCHSGSLQPIMLRTEYPFQTGERQTYKNQETWKRSTLHEHEPTGIELKVLEDIGVAGLVILNGIKGFPATEVGMHHSLTSRKTRKVSSSLPDYALCSEDTQPQILQLKVHALKKISDHKLIEMQYTEPLSDGQTHEDPQLERCQEQSKYYVLGTAGLDRFTDEFARYLEDFDTPASLDVQGTRTSLRKLHTQFMQTMRRFGRKVSKHTETFCNINSDWYDSEVQTVMDQLNHMFAEENEEQYLSRPDFRSLSALHKSLTRTKLRDRQKMIQSRAIADITTNPKAFYRLLRSYSQQAPKGMVEDWYMHGQALFPISWTEAEPRPLHKNGSITLKDNYRYIMITFILYTLYATTVNNQITPSLNHANQFFQAGFRKKHSCAHHLFTTSVLIEQSIQDKQPLHACFVDLKKAFDTVPRQLLWEAYRRGGVPECWIRAILDSCGTA